jgi:hypothetical protein
MSSRKAQLLRSTLVCFAVLGCAAVLSLPTRNARAETPAANEKEKAVLEPIQQLFDGLATHDEKRIMAQMVPDGSATLYRNGQFLQMPLSALAERLGQIVSSPDHLEERIHEPLIQIDDNIAVVWAPYKAFRNGKIDHCGTNIFSLIYREGQWLIASVVDNSRNDCAAQ